MLFSIGKQLYPLCLFCPLSAKMIIENCTLTTQWTEITESSFLVTFVIKEKRNDEKNTWQK